MLMLLINFVGGVLLLFVVFLLLIEAAGEEIIDTFFIDSFDTQRELKLKYTPFGVTFWLCKTYL
jgi:hypothetical protein